MKEYREKTAEFSFMSTAPGATFIALIFGFSLVGSLVLGCSIGYYFYKQEMEKD